MNGYRCTRELTHDELDELKQNYLFDHVDSPSYQELANSVDIPDEVIFEYYEGFDFVEDDFFCNQEEKNNG